MFFKNGEKMAIDVKKIRQQYATNRLETLDRVAELYEVDLSEWEFTEDSYKEVKGLGNDELVIFNCTLRKDGEIDIIITEIIDVHRLKYSYSIAKDIEYEIPDDSEEDEEVQEE